MMRKELFKVLSLILMLALAVIPMAACTSSTGGTTTGTTAAGTTAGTSAAATEPPSDQLEYIEAAKTKVDMEMFYNATWFDSELWGKNIASQIIQEKTGVNLTVEKPSADDNQKLLLMLTSGEKLPDFINVDFQNPALARMLKEDMIYTYDELAEKYAPNFLKMPYVVGNRDYYALDGKLYYFPGGSMDMTKINEGIYILGGGGYALRKDIYEELGSPAVKTTDDFYALLKQVQEKYPEITNILAPTNPLTGLGDNRHYNFVNYFTFGGRGYWLDDGNGNLTVHLRDPKYLDALIYLNKLVREGLITAAAFSDTNAGAFKTDMNTGKNFAMAGMLNNINSVNSELKKLDPSTKKQYIPIDPIVAPGVDKFRFPGKLGAGWMCTVITKDCDYPDRAIKFIEYMCTEEGQILGYAGREGIDWKWGGPEGKFIELIGEAKADIEANYTDWSRKYGTYQYYEFCGNQYYSNALDWGRAMNDPVKQKIYQLSADVDMSAVIYSGLSPDVDSEESVISKKLAPEIKSYVGRIALAKSEEEVRSIYAEFIKRVDDLGYQRVEKVISEKFKENKDKYANLFNQ